VNPVKAGEDVCAKQFHLRFWVGAGFPPSPHRRRECSFLHPLWHRHRRGVPSRTGSSWSSRRCLQSADVPHRSRKGESPRPAPTRSHRSRVTTKCHAAVVLLLGHDARQSPVRCRRGQHARDERRGSKPKVLPECPPMRRPNSRWRTFTANGLNWMGGGRGADKDKTLFPEFTDAFRVVFSRGISTCRRPGVLERRQFETLFHRTLFRTSTSSSPGFYGVTPTPCATRGSSNVALDPKHESSGHRHPGGAARRQRQTQPVVARLARRQVRSRTVFLPTGLPPPPANLSHRSRPRSNRGRRRARRFAVHEKEASCASCHKMMDGLGVASRKYDPVGRWRTVDQGLPVDSSGTVVETRDADGPSSTEVVELATRLGAKRRGPRVHDPQWFRYANGRSEIIADGCTLSRLYQAFDDVRTRHACVAGQDRAERRLSGTDSVQGGGQLRIALSRRMLLRGTPPGALAASRSPLAGTTSPGSGPSGAVPQAPGGRFHAERHHSVGLGLDGLGSHFQTRQRSDFRLVCGWSPER